MENLYKFQQMQDEMSRFEAAIAVSDTAAMGLLQPAMAAGTFGNMQQRMDTGTMPQYQHTNVTAMMFPPVPRPPPQMMMMPQQVQQHSAPAYPLHIDSSSQLQYQPSHHKFQPSYHEFPPSHQEFQLYHQEYQPSHSEYQPSYQEYQMHQQYHDMVGPQLMAFPPAPQPIVLSAKPKLYKLPKDAAKKEKHERKKKRKAQLLKAAEEAVLTPPFVQPPPVSAHFDAVAKPKKKKKNRKVRTAGGQVWEDVTLLDWADDDYRIFCGDLGNDVTDDLLIRTFSKYTSFQRAKVVRDKRTNKSKGFGFVSFKDPRDFMKAMKEMDGLYVGSRPIKLRKSTWKHRSLDVVRKKEKEKQALISLLMTKN